MIVHPAESGGKTVFKAERIGLYPMQNKPERKIVEMHPKYDDGFADFAVIDTYRDIMGRTKMRVITFVNREENFTPPKPRVLDETV